MVVFNSRHTKEQEKKSLKIARTIKSHSKEKKLMKKNKHFFLQMNLAKRLNWIAGYLVHYHP